MRTTYTEMTVVGRRDALLPERRSPGEESVIFTLEGRPPHAGRCILIHIEARPGHLLLRDLRLAGGANLLQSEHWQEACSLILRTAEAGTRDHLPVTMEALGQVSDKDDIEVILHWR